jgi:hypothetical protein
MKRSEMLEIIAEALLHTYGGDEVEREEARESSKMSRVIRANLALTACEKAGMTQPYIPGSYDNIQHVTPTGNIEYSYKRGWEPEE